MNIFNLSNIHFQAVKNGQKVSWTNGCAGFEPTGFDPNILLNIYLRKIEYIYISLDINWYKPKIIFVLHIYEHT